MTEIIDAIAHAYHTIRQLSEMAVGSEGAEALSLLGNLELQIARIEGESARLKQENIELRRQIAGMEVPAALPAPKPVARPVPQRADVRETMKMVSRFYQQASRQGLYKKVA